MEQTEKKEETEKKEILFFHGETSEKGFEKDYRFTIAGRYEVGVLHLAMSICSENDQFVKAQGRKLSVERLEKDEYGVIVIIANIKKGTERRIFNKFARMLQFMTKRELIELFNIRKE